MRKPLFSASDSSALLPSLALLAPRGPLNRLEQLTSSLFARHDKVTSLREEVLAANDGDRDMVRRIDAEEVMLKLVLDWLKIKAGE